MRYITLIHYPSIQYSGLYLSPVGDRGKKINKSFDTNINQISFSKLLYVLVCWLIYQCFPSRILRRCEGYTLFFWLFDSPGFMICACSCSIQMCFSPVSFHVFFCLVHQAFKFCLLKFSVSCSTLTRKEALAKLLL